MSDWPSNPIYLLGGVVSTASLESGGNSTGAMGLSLAGGASAAWFAGNAGIFVPFMLFQQATFTQAFVFNGTTASGNLDMGIYLPNGTRVVSKGSTAQAGTSAMQALDITDTTLGPGLYYMALAMDGTTGTTFRSNFSQAGRLSCSGIYTATSVFALPASVTFATAATATVLPFFGFTTRSFV